MWKTAPSLANRGVQIVKTSDFTLWLTRAAWGLLLVDLIIIFAVPADMSFDSLSSLIAYALGLVLSSIGASTWLVIRYRTFFRTWIGWAATISSLIISSMITQSNPLIANPQLSLFFSMLFIVSGWCTGVATAVMLWYRDIGLGLVAWTTIVAVWIFVLAWSFQGNLIELSLFSLSHPDEPSRLWWLNSLMCIIGWLIPLGLIGFVSHTLRLIIRECRSE